MPHVFDPGVDQRKSIRNAIVARLGQLKRTANPPLYLQSIVTLPFPLRGDDEKSIAALANALLGSAPAVAIALGRMEFTAGGGSAAESDGELEVVIYVASEYMGSTVEGRLYSDAAAAASSTVDPGVFVMLQHVRERLTGQELGVATVNELRAVEEDELLTLDNITVWFQRYRVTLDASVKPWRDVTQLVTSIEGKHQLDDIPDGTPGFDPLVNTVTNLDPPEDP